MISKGTRIAALFVLFTPTWSNAQLSFGGRPLGTDRRAALPEAPVEVMPEVNVQAYLAEDEAHAASGIKGPYRFGAKHAVDLGLENSGIWHTLSNGDRVWRLGIRCPGAYSINFEFHEFVVPDGAQVFVYNDEGDVLGAFEADSDPGHDQLGVDLLGGDRITIEYMEPLRVRGMGRLRVGQVTHGYRDILNRNKGLNDSGTCNNNVICPEGDPWRDQIRSVAMIVVSGDGICTGQLINNCNNDGIPYFLTANHCLGGTNWVFRFNWNSPTCTPTTNGSNNSTSGFTLLENSTSSDVALLRLNTTPPPLYNAFYTGWNRGTTAATSATCIHHPAGDIKKISFEQQSVSTGTYNGATCWRVAAWDDGTTEGGSSGSGLWNQDGLLVGQLFGGQADCDFNFNDYFGKFSVSAPLLEEWLGDCGTTLQGYSPFSTAVGRLPDQGLITLAPNPTQGLLRVLVPVGVEGAMELRVTDATGRTVQQRTIPAGTTQVEVDLSDRASGLYHVELATDILRMHESIVVEH